MDSIIRGLMIIVARLGCYIGHCRLTIHLAGFSETTLYYMVLVFLYFLIVCIREVHARSILEEKERLMNHQGTIIRKTIQVLTVIFYVVDVLFTNHNADTNVMSLVFTGFILVISEVLAEFISKYQSLRR